MDLKKTARWEAAIFFVMMLVSSWSETTVSSGAFYIFALIAAGISVLVYFAGMRFLPKLHEKGTGWKLVLAGGIAGALAGLLMAIASGSFSAAGALMLVMFLGGILFGFLYWIVNLQILKYLKSSGTSWKE